MVRSEVLPFLNKKVKLFFKNNKVIEGFVYDVWSSKIRFHFKENDKDYTTYIPFDEIEKIEEKQDV